MRWTQQEVDNYCEQTKPTQSQMKQRGLVHGVGVNDLPHVVGIRDKDNKRRIHSGYNQWSNMVQRCTNQQFKDKHPSYKDCELHEDWLSASKFMGWRKSQQRPIGWHLDKDLLVVGNKVYSPETCVYVPDWLNSFTLSSTTRRGGCLVGCFWSTAHEKYVSRCSNPITGEHEYLGLFTDQLVAHDTWLNRKLEIALQLKPQMDDIHQVIYPNTVTIIANL